MDELLKIEQELCDFLDAINSKMHEYELNKQYFITMRFKKDGESSYLIDNFKLDKKVD